MGRAEVNRLLSGLPSCDCLENRVRLLGATDLPNGVLQQSDAPLPAGLRVFVRQRIHRERDPGARYVIEKEVRASHGRFVMAFKKFGDVANGGTDPFELEVEYDIGNPPPNLPATKGEGGLLGRPLFDVPQAEFESRALARLLKNVSRRR